VIKAEVLQQPGLPAAEGVQDYYRVFYDFHPLHNKTVNQP